MYANKVIQTYKKQVQEAESSCSVYIRESSYVTFIQSGRYSGKEAETLHSSQDEPIGQMVDNRYYYIVPCPRHTTFALGIKEQLIFPEIEYDKIDKVRGMDIVFVTTAKTDEEARELLAQFNMPFAK